MAELWRKNCQERHTVQQQLIRALLAKPGTRGDLRLDETVDLAYLLLGPDSYWTLVDERGWPPARWERSMAEVLSAHILDDPAADSAIGSAQSLR